MFTLKGINPLEENSKNIYFMIISGTPWVFVDTKRYWSCAVYTSTYS